MIPTVRRSFCHVLLLLLMLSINNFFIISKYLDGVREVGQKLSFLQNTKIYTCAHPLQCHKL